MMIKVVGEGGIEFLSSYYVYVISPIIYDDNTSATKIFVNSSGTLNLTEKFTVI